jgi:hypothetical protein
VRRESVLGLNRNLWLLMHLKWETNGHGLNFKEIPGMFNGHIINKNIPPSGRWMGFGGWVWKFEGLFYPLTVVGF